MIRVRAAALALGIVLAAAPLSAQELMPVCQDGFDAGLSLSPTLNSAPTFVERLGGEIEASVCATGINELFDKAGWHGLALGGRALLADRSVVTPDVSEMRATALLGVSFFKVNDVSIDLNQDPTDQDQDLVTSYGWVEVGATGAYQENVDRTERGFTGGGVVRYGHERNTWIPSVAFRVEAVRPTRSAARRAAGVDEEDVHARFSTDLYWNVPLRFTSTALEDFSVGADLAWFWTSGIPTALVTADDDWESGGMVAGTARWDGSVGLLTGLALSGVSFRYSAGHQGIDAQEKDGFRLGVEVTFGS